MKKRRSADDFARRVDVLYERALSGGPFDATNEQREVREVAFALAQLRKLTESAIRKQSNLSRLPETALVAASDLLDALMQGTNHPIWRYLEAGKSHKRPNKAPASKIESMRRAWIVGTLRSLQNDVSPPLKRNAAARRIADLSRVLGVELTADQIIGWDKSFRERDDRFPDAVRTDITDILKRAGRPHSEETILKAGLGRAYYLWAVPGRVG